MLRRKNLLGVVVLFIFCLGLIPAPEAMGKEVSGTVYTPSGRPAVCAFVALTSFRDVKQRPEQKSQFTNGYGYFGFSIEDGDYAIVNLAVVRMDGMADITIRDGGNTSGLTINLSPWSVSVARGEMTQTRAPSLSSELSLPASGEELKRDALLKKSSYFDSKGKRLGYDTLDYDLAGSLVRASFFAMGDGLLLYCAFRYDSEGRLSRLSLFGDQGEVIFYSTFEWEGEHCMKISNYDSTDKLAGYALFEYDGERLSMVSQFDPEDILQSTTSYLYSTQGKLKEMELSNGSGEVLWRAELHYGWRGYLQSESCFDANGNLLSGLSLTYDWRGREIMVSYFDPNGLKSYEMKNYNPQGDLFEVSRFTARHKLLGYQTFTYFPSR